MSKIIKVVDKEHNLIEIADYRCPEVIFKSKQNPPTLQDTRNEIENLEWYCVFKRTINPFQMYEENHRLHSIIKEVREYINWRLEEHQDMYIYQMEELLEILDKENK